jgi:hypothetical protein
MLFPLYPPPQQPAGSDSCVLCSVWGRVRVRVRVRDRVRVRVKVKVKVKVRVRVRVRVRVKDRVRVRVIAAYNARYGCGTILRSRMLSEPTRAATQHGLLR